MKIPVRDVLRQIFLPHREGDRRPVAAAVWMVIAFAISIVAFQPHMSPESAGPSVRGHGSVSLENAISDVVCGFRWFHLKDSDHTVVIDHPDGFRYRGSFTSYYIWKNRPAIHVPLRQTVLDRWSDFDAYCQHFPSMYQPADVGILALNSLLLHAYNDLSLYQLGLALYGIKLLILGAAVYFVLRCGAPVLLSVALIGSAFGITDGLYRDYYYSHYAFIPYLILALATALASLFLRRGHATIRSLVIFGVSLGVLLCIAANVRITLLFVGLGMIAAAVVFIYAGLPEIRRGPFRLPRAGMLCVLVGSLAFGFAATEKGAFERFKIPQEQVTDAVRQTVTYHPMSHAIIVGLAFPPDDPPEVGVIEGFEFGDHTARQLALRLDPTIGDEFSDRYERLLWNYVGHLWFTYPWKMVKAYAKKLVYSVKYSYSLCYGSGARHMWLSLIPCTAGMGPLVGIVLIPVLFWRRVVSNRSALIDRIFTDPDGGGGTLYFLFFLTCGAALMLAEMTITFYTFTAHMFMAIYALFVGVWILLALLRAGIDHRDALVAVLPRFLKPRT